MSYCDKYYCLTAGFSTWKLTTTIHIHVLSHFKLHYPAEQKHWQLLFGQRYRTVEMTHCLITLVEFSEQCRPTFGKYLL